MQIVDLSPTDDDRVYQTASLLVEAFKEHWPEAWPDMSAALEEVRESFEDGRVSRIALDDRGSVLGWVGGIPQYDGHVWELHPLVVAPSSQGQGIGRLLVEDLESLAAAAGVDTIFLGTDDEDGMTSLSNVDLYSDLPAAIAGITNLNRHPYEFYQKVGFVIVGVLPDANGPGKPDIYMAKKVRKAGEAD
jgi:aminoglycoside 6'-N-acetyltransferase I